MAAMCTAEEIEKGTCNWTLPVDVGIPAKQLFNIVMATVVFLFFAAMIHVVFLVKQIKPPTADESLLLRFSKTKGFWYRSLFLILALAWGVTQMEETCTAENCGNWRLVFWYGLFLILSSNVASGPAEFYLGQGLSLTQQCRFFLFGKATPTTNDLEEVVVRGLQEDGNVGFWTLMPSVFITWIFAKSIFNTANLGGMYGMWGGLAYASWYVSFFTAGTVCYILRTKYGFKSFMSAIYTNYGAAGTTCYMFAIMFRLFNEIWSNATVIGSFYGPPGSKDYWGVCWLSTLIPATYVLMGGMRASLFSDTVQAFIAVTFLVVVLCTIQSDNTFSTSTNVFTFEPQKGWEDGWWACFCGGLLQGVLSYPFFDPVLTDRGFLSTPKTMLKAFFTGGMIAASFIFFYAAIGVYGTFYHEYWADACACLDGIATTSDQTCPSNWNPCSRLGSKDGDSAFAAWVLGHQTYAAVEVFVTFVMITASMSTLDSTFTSWSKFVSLELGGWLKLSGDQRGHIGPLEAFDLKNVSSSHMLMARCSIVLLMVLGVAFLGTEKDAMKATSSAGTMVMGIGPPIWMMTVWRTKDENRKGWVQAPLAFVVPSLVGFVMGYLYYSDGKEGEGVTYDSFMLGDYYYSRFLGTNVWGHIMVFATFVLCFAFHQLLPNVWFYKLPEVERVGKSFIGVGICLPASMPESKSDETVLVDTVTI